MTRSAHSPTPPWLVTRLLAELDTKTTYAEELRLALDVHGIRDRERALLALLGVMAFATRAGCRPDQVRRVVAWFARSAAEQLLHPAATDALVRRCTGFVDAVYLLYGDAQVADDVGVVAAALASA